MHRSCLSILALFGLVLSALAQAPYSPPEPLGPSSRKTGLVISEIMYQPAARADGRLLEYLELYNSNPYPEDLGGYRLAGPLEYVFPANTIIAGRAFLVLARVPADVQSVYGLSGVLGYGATNYVTNVVSGATTIVTNIASLAQTRTLELRNPQGAVCLRIPYANEHPWPVAADGAGHSLVLWRPSYGESDPRAWGPSDVKGGSPGREETPGGDPLRNVVFNEIYANADAPSVRYLELYNHGNQTVDLNGAWLTDDPATNKFRFLTSMTIGPRGCLFLTDYTLNFNPDSLGETLYLINAANTRVLDAVRYGPQARGISLGRVPDGGPEVYPLASRTAGVQNSPRLLPEVVINEIMYAPISGDADDEYLEIYNRGTAAVRLDGWQLQGGISFSFPTNTLLPADEYLVIARNVTNLFVKYPLSLGCGRLIGNYAGRLANAGERIALTRPETILSTNKSGRVSTNLVQVAVEEVTYGTWGRWGKWARGGGASLERIDPRSNPRLAASWADSAPPTNSDWVTLIASSVLEQGQGLADGLQILLMGEGECLVDDVLVLARPDPMAPIINMLPNSTFEGGLDGWTVAGNHGRSSLEPPGSLNESYALHLRASGPGDPLANGVSTLSLAPIPPNQSAKIQARVRWLRGSTNILFRLRGNYMECAGSLPVPAALGTPGARNSRAVTNAGPAIYGVVHSPLLPTNQQSVLVTARADDRDGVGSFLLKYRLDPATNYTALTLWDNGTSGDAVAGDGIYSATLPGQPAGTLVAYYVQATDLYAAPATTFFPADAPQRECLVRFGEPRPTNSNFGVYRLWLTQANLAAWTNRPALDREPLDATFVYGDARAIYNVTVRYAADPLLPVTVAGLDNPGRFAMSIPGDDPLFGATELNRLQAPGVVPGDDATLQRNLTGQWMARQLGLPWAYQRLVYGFINGVRQGMLLEDTQVPNLDFLEQWFPNDSGGDLFELQAWLELGDTPGSVTNYGGCTLNDYRDYTGAHDLARYRVNWTTRSSADLNTAYQELFRLNDAVQLYTNGLYWTPLEDLADVEQWMRFFAFQHALGHVESFGHRDSRNSFAYRPLAGQWQLLPADLNLILDQPGANGPTGDDLFQSDPEDQAIGRLYGSHPTRRAFWRAIKELVEGPLRSDQVEPLLDAKYAAFQAAGLAAASPASVKTWIASRRTYLSSHLATVAASFAVSGPAIFTTNQPWLVLSGVAPIAAESIRINGFRYALAWTSLTNWSLDCVLNPGVNQLEVQGYDRFGLPLAGARISLTITCTRNAPSPQGQVVISEIMYNPLNTPDFVGESYVELHNRSTNDTFDLSGWVLDGVGVTFPLGTFLPPQGYLVVVGDRARFVAAYGDQIPIAGYFNGGLNNAGETLTLLIPGASLSRNVVIDKVRYESVAPWPAEANGQGAALQLLDAAQDNSRVANWAVAPTNQPAGLPPVALATPGMPNSTQAVLAPFPPLWLNEVQPENRTGPTNQAGQRRPWLELHNASTNALDLSDCFLSDNFTNLVQWQFPTGTVLGAGQFLLAWALAPAPVVAEPAAPLLDPGNGLPPKQANGVVELNTSLVLHKTNGVVALSRRDNGQLQILDYLRWSDLPADYSYGSYPDGQGTDREPFLYATPGASNNVPLMICINEWMAANTVFLLDPADNDLDDWFELYNAAYHPVDLSGFFLTDNLTNKNQWRLPDGAMIRARGHLLVWADGEPEQNSPGARDLHANFTLSRNGEAIGLFAPNLDLVDAITFGPQTDNLSQGRYPDGSTNLTFMSMPTPRAANFVPDLSVPPPPTEPRRIILPPGYTTMLVVESADVPFEAMGVTLGPKIPPGVFLDPITKLIRWSPPPELPPGIYELEYTICDVRPGGISYTGKILLILELPLELTNLIRRPGNLLSFSWLSVSGLTYRVQFRDHLLQGAWTNWGADLSPTTTPFSVNVPLGTNGARYYRLLRL